MPPRRSPAQRSPERAAIACERVSQSKVQSFKKGSGELLLPGAPQTAGIRFCCPVGPTAFYLGNLRALAPQLRSKSKSLVIVGTCRDRQSVVSGKSVSVGVDIGGRSMIKKKNEEKKDWK